MAQCTAISKRTGERCKGQAVTGRNVCRMHGGKSPAGVAASQFQTGRYSRYLPASLLTTYQAALADQDLLTTREAIALAEARITLLLQGLEGGEGKGLWQAARAAFTGLDTAIRAGDSAGLIANVRALERIMQTGVAQTALWDEIGEWLEKARRLRETEQKRLIAMQQVITSEQAMALVAALTAAVKNHVTEPDTLRAIADEFARTLSRADPGITAR